jgi:hypothetical protein
MASKLTEIRVQPTLQIEAEALPDISESFEVDAVPYFILLRVSSSRFLAVAVCSPFTPKTPLLISLTPFSPPTCYPTHVHRPLRSLPSYITSSLSFTPHSPTARCYARLPPLHTHAGPHAPHPTLRRPTFRPLRRPHLTRLETLRSEQYDRSTRLGLGHLRSGRRAG